MSVGQWNIFRKTVQSTRLQVSLCSVSDGLKKKSYMVLKLNKEFSMYFLLVKISKILLLCL